MIIRNLLQNHIFHGFKLVFVSCSFLCGSSRNKLWVEAKESWKDKYHGIKTGKSLSRGEKKPNWGELMGNPRRKGMKWEVKTPEVEKASYHIKNLAPENNLEASFCCFINWEVFGFSLLLWRRNRKYKLTGTKQKITYINGKKTGKVTFIFFLLTISSNSPW